MLFVSMALLVSAAGYSLASTRYKRTVAEYSVPDVVLTNQDGKKVRLRSLLQGEEPVVVDFIFSTCTTICPVLSASFADLQRELEGREGKIRLISISIDPEHDTPEVMKSYLERYQAGPDWQYLTGSRRDIDRVTAAFDAFPGSKMEHYLLSFVRQSRSGEWVRLFGMLSGEELLGELNKVGVR